MTFVDENFDVQVKNETIDTLAAEIFNHARIIIIMGKNLYLNYFQKGEYNLKVDRIKKYCFLLQKLNELTPLVDDVYNYVKEKKE